MQTRVVSAWFCLSEDDGARLEMAPHPGLPLARTPSIATAGRGHHRPHERIAPHGDRFRQPAPRFFAALAGSKPADVFDADIACSFPIRNTAFGPCQNCCGLPGRAAILVELNLTPPKSVARRPRPLHLLHHRYGHAADR